MSDLKTVYLKDYQVPAYLIKKTDLLVQIFEEYTEVTSSIDFIKNPQSEKSELQLFGVDLQLIRLAINDFETL